MQRITLLFAALLVAFDVPRDAWSVERPSRGRTRFEVFGMLNEYASRVPDGATIEGFYSSEVETRPAVVAHFEELLREFCGEEHLAPKYEKKNYPQGGIAFVSPPIAEVIDKYYRTGALDESVFDDASDEDLLRYVAGAYLREGDRKKRAVLYMANAARKMRTVGVILARLGCKHVRMYSSRMKLIPTTYVLLFSPSPKVKTNLGILSEAALSDLGDPLDKVLSLEEEIGPNATAGRKPLLQK
jgi:hypothetical protein